MALMEVLAKVGFDWRLALTNLVNFGLIVWLLAKFLWPSISKAISERQKIINQGLEDAEAAKERLAKSQSDYQAKLVQAHQEANLVVDVFVALCQVCDEQPAAVDHLQNLIGNGVAVAFVYMVDSHWA